MKENNEILVNEEVNNEVDVVEEDYEVSDCSGSGFGKLLVGLVVVGGAGLAAWAYKNKAKLEDRKIEKLRKKGYVIYREDEVAAIREVDDVDSEEFDETIE